MRLDELIDQTTIHEQTAVMVDRRVTMASRTALACCAAVTLIFNRTRADDATNLVGFIVDWFRFPTAGFTYSCATLLAGVVLCLITKGFTQANEQEHKAIVGFTSCCGVGLIVVAIIAMFAATIGFAVLVLWALTQIN